MERFMQLIADQYIIEKAKDDLKDVENAQVIQSDLLDIPSLNILINLM
jgi:hypothetical protein